MKKIYSITINNKTYRVGLEETEGIYEVEIDGTKFLASIAYDDKKDAALSSVRQVGELNVQTVSPAKPQDSQNKILSPLAAAILKINCKAGDSLKKGDVVLTIEAMKMETEIYSPRDIKITNVLAAEGQNVASGEPLIEYE